MGLLLAEHRDCKFDPLAALVNTATLEERTQVLLYQPRAEIPLSRHFLVAAALDERIRHLLNRGA